MEIRKIEKRINAKKDQIKAGMSFEECEAITGVTLSGILNNARFPALYVLLAELPNKDREELHITLMEMKPYQIESAERITLEIFKSVTKSNRHYLDACFLAKETIQGICAKYDELFGWA